MQGWLNCGKLINVIHSINRLNGKKCIIIAISGEKAFDMIQQPFIIKTQKSRNREAHPQLDKRHLQKPTTNLIFNGEV